MALLVQQPSLLTVQNILDTVSIDLRYQLSSTSQPDQGILLSYADRVQKELLLQSRYAFLLSPIVTFLTVPGKTDYYIGVNGCPSTAVNTGLSQPAIGAIKKSSVNDMTNDRVLYNIREAPLSDIITENQPPRWYRWDSATPDLVNLYPPPDGEYLISFRYYSGDIDLNDVGDVVQVPNKYKHVLIAGINEMAFGYLKRADELRWWAGKYGAGKISIIRDQNLFPGGPQFLTPDPSTQYRNQWGDDFFQLLWNSN